MKRILFILMFIFSISLVNSALDDAIVYYSFDEDDTTGTTMIDISGNGNNGTCINMASNCNTINGKLINSTSFDGINDRLTLGDLSSVSGNKTVSMWVYLNDENDAGGSDYLFDSWTGAGDRNIFAVYAPTGTFRYYTVADGWKDTTQSYVLNNWHYINFVFDTEGTNLNFYYDGSFIINLTVTDTSLSTLNTLGTNYNFGAGFLNGTLDEFSIYNRALNSSEILELYNSNAGFNPYAIISTNIQSYYNLENISIDITTLQLTNLTYSLDGASNVSIWTNQNTGTLNLNSLSIGTHDITFYDNESNALTESFEYQPYQYLYFTNSTGGAITNFQLDGISYIDYANFTASSVGLGEHQFTFTKTGFETTNFNRTFTINTQLNETIQVPFPTITINIKDMITNTVVTGETFNLNFIGTTGYNTTTTTGTKTLENILEDGTYTLITTSTNYNTETNYLTFDAATDVNITVYVLNSTDTNEGTVVIEVLDTDGAPIEDATVSAKQWDSPSSSYVVVSSAKTASDGKGTLNIVLNDEIYKFRAETDSVNTETVEQIITTANDGRTITITLNLGAINIPNYEYETLTTSVSESYNNATNVSTITFVWSNSLGTNVQGCINLYRIQNYQQNRLTTNCTTSSSATKIKAYTLDTSNYDYIIKAEFYDGTSYSVVKSFTHYKTGNLFEILEENNLHLFILMLLTILSVYAGIALQNIYIGTMGLIFSTVISIYIAPSIITASVAGFLFFIGVVTLWGSTK